MVNQFKVNTIDLKGIIIDFKLLYTGVNFNQNVKNDQCTCTTNSL